MRQVVDCAGRGDSLLIAPSADGKRNLRSSVDVDCPNRFNYPGFIRFGVRAVEGVGSSHRREIDGVVRNGDAGAARFCKIYRVRSLTKRAIPGTSERESRCARE